MVRSLIKLLEEIWRHFAVRGPRTVRSSNFEESLDNLSTYHSDYFDRLNHQKFWFKTAVTKQWSLTVALDCGIAYQRPDKSTINHFKGTSRGCTQSIDFVWTIRFFHLMRSNNSNCSRWIVSHNLCDWNSVAIRTLPDHSTSVKTHRWKWALNEDLLRTPHWEPDFSRPSASISVRSTVAPATGWEIIFERSVLLSPTKIGPWIRTDPNQPSANGSPVFC